MSLSIQAKINMLMDEKTLIKKVGNNGHLAALQKQAAAYQGACVKVDVQKAELYDSMAEEKISREKYKLERDKLSWERQDMERQAAEAEIELAELRDKLAAARQGEPKLMRYLHTDTLNRIDMGKGSRHGKFLWLAAFFCFASPGFPAIMVLTKGSGKSSKMELQMEH